MATHKFIGIDEPTTVDSKLDTIELTINSSAVRREVLVLGDPDSSNAIAAVLNTTPASTAWGVVVREAVPQSTGPFAISAVAGTVTIGGLVRSTNSVAADFQATVIGTVRSTNNVPADLRATIYQSTAADLNVTVAGYSTTINISSLAGAVMTRSSAADALVTVYQSSASNLLATVSQGGTWNIGTVTTITGVTTVSSLAGVVMARLQDSSGIGIAGSTGPTAIGVNGLVTREVMPAIQSTTVLITSTHSTALYVLISSVAGQRQKVFAYFVSSTHTVPSTLVFMSSNTIDRWHVGFGSGSSGMSGANMGISAPAWIFATDAANALNVRIEGGSSITSTVIARISISYFSEA